MEDIVFEFLENELKAIKNEHNLDMQFKRYKTVTKEVIKEYRDNTPLSEESLIACSYISDYIMTSSEIRITVSDEERVKDLINLFQHLPDNFNEWKDLTHHVGLIYAVASIARKRYYFQLDKGITKNIACLRVSSYLLRHVINFCTQHFPTISFLWFVYVLEAALLQTIFSTVIEEMQILEGSKDDIAGIITCMMALKMKTAFAHEINDTVPVPNIVESESVSYISLKEMNKEFFYEKGETKVLKHKLMESLPEITVRDTQPHILKYLRLESLKDQRKDKNIFYLGYQDSIALGYFGIISSIDDINLKEIESLFSFKIKDFCALYKYEEILKNYPLEIEEKKDLETVPEETREEKKGLLKTIICKIKNVFSRIPNVVQIEKKNVFIQQWLEYFNQELLYSSVSGIEISPLPIFDDYRENDFLLTGIIKSERKDIEPTTLISEKEIVFPTEILDPVISLIKFSKEWLTIIDYHIDTLFPEEVLYEEKDKPDALRLVEFVKNEDKLFGVVADKIVPRTLNIPRKEQIYKRRTLMKKLRELDSTIASRKDIDIRQAGEKVFPADINWEKMVIVQIKQRLFF